MLNIYCFGHFRMTYQNNNLAVTLHPQPRRLLLYLLLNRDQVFQRNRLASTLWPDGTESEALKMLRHSLHDLTSSLPEKFNWITKVDSSLQWNPDSHYWLDVAEFERLSHIPKYADRALDLYTDDLLIGYADAWIEPERERLRTLYINTAEMVLDRYQQQGKLTAAIDIARQVLTYDACLETIVQKLMQLHYQNGNRAAAIQTFEDFSEALWEELAVEPMDETLTLQEAIINETLEMPSPIELDMLAAPFSVPAPVTSLVGRDDELLELSDLLQRTNPVRHITLLGPPGVGKTRLATEVARRLRDYYRDGVFFVNLSDVSDAEKVGSTIATQILTAVDPDAKPTFDVLKAHLQGHYLLLVLDNFEQVLGASDVVSELLSLSNGIQILVTSRVPLKLPEEVEFTPTLLIYPETEISLEAAPDYSAVTLFTERSRQRKSSFALTEDNLSIVTNICRQLDGLPLAIELVAARVGEMDPSAIEQELADRFALLTSDLYNIDPRHRTLQTAITWSVDLLPMETQQAFAQLGVFASGWTLESAEQIIDDNIDADNLMETLSDHHLIIRRETEFGQRFDMLVSIREYALDILMQASDAYEAFENFGSYFAGLAEEARENWHGDEMAFWLRRLRLEEENLRRVLQWAFAGDDTAIEERILYGVRLASALNRFWQAQGKVQEGLGWMETALPFRDQLDVRSQIVFAIRTAHFMTAVRQDYEGAIQLLEDALPLAHESANIKSIVDVLNEIGNIYHRQGEWLKASQYYDEAIAHCRANYGIIDPSIITPALNNLGQCKMHLGDFTSAETLVKEALDIRRQLNDVEGIVRSLTRLGHLAGVCDQFNKSREFFLEAFNLIKETKHRFQLITLFYGFASIAGGLDWPIHSARLYGFLDAFAVKINRPAHQDTIEWRDKYLAKARQELGDERVEELLTDGAQMSLEEVLDYITETFS